MMDHKEVCLSWVEERKFEGDDGKWYVNEYGELKDSFDDEDALDDYLWTRAIQEAHENYLP